MQPNDLDHLNESHVQAGDADLTLDLTQNQADGASRPHRVVPYAQFNQVSQAERWDKVRKYVTLGLLAMFGWVVVWASIESKSWPDHWAQTKEMLQTILPAVTGLLGSVIGFYFGSNANSNGAGKSGTGSGDGK